MNHEGYYPILPFRLLSLHSTCLTCVMHYEFLSFFNFFLSSFSRFSSGTCDYHRNVGGFPAIRLCNTYWNAQDIINEFSMESVILGMASQITEAEDSIVISDLRDYLFGPMHFSRRDLCALSMMRGRDNGLPDYNTARRLFNLPERRRWEDINREDAQKRPLVYERLAELYKDDISNLDMYVGGMLEMSANGPGELFKQIIKDQFYRLRAADRFWFENRNFR